MHGGMEGAHHLGQRVTDGIRIITTIDGHAGLEQGAQPGRIGARPGGGQAPSVGMEEPATQAMPLRKNQPLTLC